MVKIVFNKKIWQEIRSSFKSCPRGLCSFVCCFGGGVIPEDREMVLGGDGGLREGAAGACAAVRHGDEWRSQPRLCRPSGDMQWITVISVCRVMIIIFYIRKKERKERIKSQLLIGGRPLIGHLFRR